jgi:hypothetical protein
MKLRKYGRIEAIKGFDFSTFVQLAKDGTQGILKCLSKAFDDSRTRAMFKKGCNCNDFVGFTSHGK